MPGISPVSRCNTQATDNDQAYNGKDNNYKKNEIMHKNIFLSDQYFV